MSGNGRILMLGLDAADHDLVQRLIRAGRLPHLAKLAGRGTTGRLRSPAGLYTGGVWPTFYTGQPVARHGVFHNKEWRPGAMRVEVPTPEWTSAVPFWEAWPEPGPVTLIVDVPMALGRPRPLKGVYLGGWGTHDLIGRGSWPTGLWGELEQRFGAPAMPREEYGRQSPESHARLAAALRMATEQLRDITLELIDRHPWQFACVVFGAVHRAGHYLWDRSQVEPGTQPAAPDDLPTDALLDLYEGLDAAVGKIIERAPAETLVIAFAVHGMGPNPGWSDLLADILARVDEHRTGRAPKRGWLYRLRRTVPHRWQRRFLELLPAAAIERIVPLWSRRMYDWSTTRSFPLPMDEAGYFRINLRGRERDGIVAEGEYDEACAGLEALIASFRDEASGTPIAGQAVRAYRDAGPEPTCRELLPDLIVPWTGPAARATRRLVSTMLPGFHYEVPVQLPSGRSGNHRDRGWFIAAGPGVAAGTTVAGYDVLDLLPTIRARLGLPPDPGLPGRPIAEITGA
ncbi:MAG: alkaline phosphatase family protein [Gemmatimonadota bacterium]|nr:alkaline phosphatase family protein [Gemmatimonadota bacterium]